MSAEHRLERRSALLAARLKERVKAVRDAVASPGQRPPFHVALPRSEALAWWRDNLDTDLGKKVLSTWTPDQIADLQVELSRFNEQQALAGPPAA